MDGRLTLSSVHTEPDQNGDRVRIAGDSHRTHPPSCRAAGRTFHCLPNQPQYRGIQAVHLRGASLGCPQSIASVYCVRSLVPGRRRSRLRAANCSAITAAAGISTMMPAGTVGTPRLAASSASMAFTCAQLR